MKKSFGEKLEELRGAMTQKEFARSLDIPLTTYTNWRLGLRTPSIEAVSLISSRFGVSTDWLLGLADDKKAIVTSTPIVREKPPRYPSPSPPADLMGLLATYADTISRQSRTIEKNAETINSQQQTIAHLAVLHWTRIMVYLASSLAVALFFVVFVVGVVWQNDFFSCVIV